MADRAIIVSENKLGNLRKQLQERGKRIVFTCGAYDLIHSGQTHFLAEARTWGDVLVVGISDDESRRALRGVGHPLIDEEGRAETLSALRPVDFVVPVNERELFFALSALQPDVFYTIGEDWNCGIRSKDEQKLIKDFGGNVVKAERLEPFISSSDIVEKIAQSTIRRNLKSFFGSDSFGQNGESPPYLELGRQYPRDLLSYAYLGEFVRWEELPSLRKKLKSRGKTISFVSGSYDLVHVGHVRFIEKAKSWGDLLVVGIPSDQAIRKLKGASRPVVGESSRAELLRFFRAVDYITIFPQTTVEKTLELLKPDIFQTVEEGWNNGYKNSREYKTVTAYGGEVKLVSRQAPYVSSHALINRAAGLRIKEIFKQCLDATKINNDR
ncbi:MAG: adenylyltransferase/cytidyltransferase family protein [Patescibacteria group bacterium]|nr:adenylyltransferase/cytidyltransferase family protein [Patescibacteria group bacterium]